MIPLEAYGFHLSDSQIARQPADPPESARLLRVPRRGPVSHHRCVDLPALLPAESLLIANDTRVVRARLEGRRDSGGRIEALFSRPLDDGSWLALVRGTLKDGESFDLAGVRARFLGRDGFGLARLDLGATDVARLMAERGELPLPPYMNREATTADDTGYQTSYARHDGAVAAPTAGLHFSVSLRDSLSAAGHRLETLTLHVGPGTFLPVRTDDPLKHRVPGEWASVDGDLLESVRRRLVRGRPVIAIGTTATRALETALRRAPRDGGFEGWVDLTIAPPHRFRGINGLLSNFHLPDSSLMLLVAAWAGRRRVLAAYEKAVAEGYRFYSYGDLTWFE